MGDPVSLPEHHMTVDEFYDWWDREGGDFKYELVGGKVQFKYRDPKAMGRSNAAHARAMARVYTAFSEAIREQGAPCEILPEGLAVRVSDASIRLPDLALHCGQVDDSDTELSQPVILIEIVSPSSDRRDAVEKLLEYFEIDSLRHYLIIYPEKRAVVLHSRADDGQVMANLHPQSPLSFDPPGISLRVEDLLGSAS